MCKIANNTISVIIPTLNNRPSYLIEAIKSIMMQTIKPYEIIVINNGREELLIPNLNDNFDVPLRVFKTVYKAGSSQARNFGGALARGKYLSFLDDDDMWGNTYLEIIHEKIEEESEPDCLVARLDRMTDEGIVPFKNPEDQLKKEILLIKNPSCTGSTVTVKKKSFLDSSGYNPILKTGQDKSIVLDMIINGYKIIPVAGAQAILRDHGGDRNTDKRIFIKGLELFYYNYKSIMSPSQKIINKLKKYSLIFEISPWWMFNLFSIFLKKITIIYQSLYLKKM